MAERTQQPVAPVASEDQAVPSLGTAAPPERTFDEAAVAQILKRVAALEQKRRVATAELTVVEIEQIARESGMDPALVRQAVRDLEHQQQAQSSGRLFGAPTVWTLERVVPGELRAEDHEALAMELRSTLAALCDRPVLVGSLGRSLTASSSVGRIQVEVQLTPRGDQTVLRVAVNSSRFARGIFGGMLGGMGGAVGVNVGLMTATTSWRGGVPLPAAIAAGAVAFLGVFSGAFASARAVVSSRVGRTHRELERLADRLERELLARRR